MAGGQTPPSALAAARFIVTVDGVEVAQFAELVELVSGVDPSALTLVDSPKRGAGARKLPGKRTPPTVTLKRALTNDLSVFAWHGDALGRRGARKDAVLTMFDVQGRPVAKYSLVGAWPAKVVVGGDKVGVGQLLVETITFVCDDVQRVAP